MQEVEEIRQLYIIWQFRLGSQVPTIRNFTQKCEIKSACELLIISKKNIQNLLGQRHTIMVNKLNGARHWYRRANCDSAIVLWRTQSLLYNF